jgi:hypothetical protein
VCRRRRRRRRRREEQREGDFPILFSEKLY